MNKQIRITSIALFLVCLSRGLTAQTAETTARLREVLPADVAERVLARIAEARARNLPAAVLEQRALKFAARGVAAEAIEKSVAEHADRMLGARTALNSARTQPAADDELEAGAEALRKGVSAAQLSTLARGAPAGRSLAMPLYALGSLLDRGLPADQAVQRVHDRLAARAADVEFQKMSTEVPGVAPGQANKPELTGTDLAATRRAANTPNGRAVGRPSGVPGNAGKDTRPTPGKGTTPPGRGRGRGGESL